MSASIVAGDRGAHCPRCRRARRPTPGGCRVAHRRGAIRRERVPTLLGRAVAERARTCAPSRRARSPRNARARARLRRRTSLSCGCSGRSCRHGDRLGTGEHRPRATNAEANGLTVDAAVLDWTSAHDLDSEQYDVVLAADVLYEERNAEPLLRLTRSRGRSRRSRADRRSRPATRRGVLRASPGRRLVDGRDASRRASLRGDIRLSRDRLTG